MRHSAHHWQRRLSFIILLSMLLSFLPAPLLNNTLPGTEKLFPEPAAAAATSIEATNGTRGNIIFATDIDSDDDPLTNPTKHEPVPLGRVQALDINESVEYTEIGLAVEVLPSNPDENPVHTTVHFRLWNQAGSVDLQRTANADSWGAAIATFVLDEEHLQGPFYYQAYAEDFGSTENRTFEIANDTFFVDMLLNRVFIETEYAKDGRVTLNLQTKYPIDEAADAISLVVVPNTSEGANLPQTDQYPPLYGERLNTYQGRSTFYLDPGTYTVIANIQSGNLIAQSAPIALDIQNSAAPPISYIEGMQMLDTERALVQYRTNEGYAVIGTRSAAELETTHFVQSYQDVFTEDLRVGAFEWHTTLYSRTIEIKDEAAGQIGYIDNFKFDPIERVYTFDLIGAQTEAQVYPLSISLIGAEQSVLQKLESEVILEQGRSTPYRIAVPLEYGSNVGLRVQIGDQTSVDLAQQHIPGAQPDQASNVMDWLIQPLSNMATIGFNMIKGGDGVLGFGLAVGFQMTVSILSIKLYEQYTTCSISSAACDTKRTTVFSSNWLELVVRGLRDYMRDQFGITFDTLGSLAKIADKGLPIGGGRFLLFAALRFEKDFIVPECATGMYKNYIKGLGGMLKELEVNANQLLKKFKNLSQNFTPSVPISLPAIFLELKPMFTGQFHANTKGDSLGILVDFRINFGGDLFIKIKGPPLAEIIKMIKQSSTAIQILRGFLEFMRLFQVAKKYIDETRNLRPFPESCEPEPTPPTPPTPPAPPTPPNPGPPNPGPAPQCVPPVNAEGELIHPIGTTFVYDPVREQCFPVNEGSLEPNENEPEYPTPGNDDGWYHPEDEPPPPNGSPDDRLDAFTNRANPAPRGTSGDIMYLQQRIAIAERLNLDLAKRYWTAQLRQAEVRQFINNTAASNAYQADLNTIAESAELQVQGLLSGTIPYTPSATLTDAVELVFTQYITDITTTAYDQEFTRLEDSLEFAQNQYTQVLGRELQLFQELRAMETEGGLGVLDSGLITWALGGIGSVGIDATPVQILPGISSSQLPNSRYFSPFEAPKVLLVPSGGLNSLKFSSEARDWLETYVQSGGTLIVLAQAEGTDWEMLPGGELRGLGYYEDILCNTASVRITGASPWIDGISRDLPDIQLDGSFTSWPQNAEIILMRTTGNQMPAMLEYEYGQGRVIATSTYPDFYMNGLQSYEDAIFARSLFSLAYLEATDQAPVVDVLPGEQTSINLTVRNTTAGPISKVTLWSDFYSSKIAESWRWAAHQESSLRANQIVTLNPPMVSGEARTITFSFTAPEAFTGIFRTGYFLGTSSGIAGPFYRVLSTVSRGLLMQVVRDQPGYQYGETAVVDINLRNLSDTAYTVSLQSLDGLSTNWSSITVAPQSTTTVSTTKYMVEDANVRIAAVENGKTVAMGATILELRQPSLGISLNPAISTVGLPLSITAQTILDTDFLDFIGTQVDWQVIQNGTVIQTTNSQLIPENGRSTSATTLNLPAPNSADELVISARMPNTTIQISQTIPVRDPASIQSMQVTPLAPGQTNPNALRINVSDIGLNGTASLSATFRQGATILSTTPVVTFTIGQGMQDVLLDVPMPASINLLQTYSIEATLQAQATGASNQSYATQQIPVKPTPPNPTLLEGMRLTGEPITVRMNQIVGDIQLPQNATYRFVLRNPKTGFSQTTTRTNITPINGVYTFNVNAPTFLPAGFYDLEVSVNSLSNWSSILGLKVPASLLRCLVPGEAQTGTSFDWTLVNNGVETTTISGTLAFINPAGLQAFQQPLQFTLDPREPFSVPITVPNTLQTDTYLVTFEGVDHIDDAVTCRNALAIDGRDINVRSESNLLSYILGLPLVVTSTVNIDTAVAGAVLHQRVTKPEPLLTADISTVYGALEASDGIGQAARFNYPGGLDISSDGTFLLIADTSNDIIRRITLSTGEVKTIAGKPIAYHYALVDGPSALARFSEPHDIAISPDQTFALISEQNSIRRIDLATNAVRTIAGGDQSGFQDGAGDTALFYAPDSMAFSPDGTFALVVDRSNYAIRKLTFQQDGSVLVATIAGTGATGNVDGPGNLAQFQSLGQITISPDASFALVADQARVRRIDLSTNEVSTLGTDTGVILGLAIAPDMTWVATGQSRSIQRMELTAPYTSTILAGTPGLDVRFNDGVAGDASMYSPVDLAFTPDGSRLYFVDNVNSVVRQLDVTTREVSTLAGASLYSDPRSWLDNSRDVVVTPDGNQAIVLDNYVLRTVDLATETTSHLAGYPGVSGTTDGVGYDARLPYGDAIALNHAGTHVWLAYIYDDIREVNLATGETTSLSVAIPESVYAIHADPANANALLYSNGSALKRLDLTTGTRTTVATGFNRAEDFALSSDGSFAVVADSSNYRVYRVDLPSGTVSVLAGSGTYGHTDGIGTSAQFRILRSIVLNPANTMAVVYDNQLLRSIDIATGTVTTRVGSTFGFQDGTGSTAKLRSGEALAFTPDGTQLIVTDTANKKVRTVDPTTWTIRSFPQYQDLYEIDGIGNAATFHSPEAIATDASGTTAFVLDYYNHSMRKIDLQTDQVTTVVGDRGRTSFDALYADGIGETALFDEPREIDLSPDGSFALASDGTLGGAIRKIDMETREVTTLVGTFGQQGFVDAVGTAARFARIECIRISPDSSFALICDENNQAIRRLDLATLEVTTVLTDINSLYAIAITPDQSGVYFSSYNGFQYLDFATGALTDPMYGAFYDIELTSDGRYAYVHKSSSWDGIFLQRIDLETNTFEDVILGNSSSSNVWDGRGVHAGLSWVSDIVLGPNDEYLLVVGGNPGAVRRIDLVEPTHGILFEQSTTLDQATTTVLTADLSALLDVPTYLGAMHIETILYAAEPSELTPTLRPVLAYYTTTRQIYRDTLPALTVVPEQIATRPNRPNTASDDQAALSLFQGQIYFDGTYYSQFRPNKIKDDPTFDVMTNEMFGTQQTTQTGPYTVTLSAERNYEDIFFEQTFTNIPGGWFHHFVLTDSVQLPSYLNYNIQANSTTLDDWYWWNGSEWFSTQIQDPNLSYELSVYPRLAAVEDPVVTQVAFTNGPTPAFVSVDFGTGPRDYMLPANQVVNVTELFTFTTPGSYAIPFTVTGDVSITDTLQVNVGAGTPIEIDGFLPTNARDATTLIQGEAAAVGFVITNTQPFSIEALLDFSVQSPVEIRGGQSLLIEPGRNDFTIPLGADFTVGDHTATLTTTILETNLDPLVKVFPFTIVPPRLDLVIDTQTTEPDQDGVVDITLTAINNLTSDADWAGRLELSGDLVDRQDVALVRGSSATVSYTLDLSDRAGVQTIDAHLVEADGTVRAHQVIRVLAQPRFTPDVTLVDIAAAPAAVEGTATISVTLDNPGIVGDVPLIVNAFGESVRQFVAVPGEGQQTVLVQFPVPAGLLADQYAISAQLDATVVEGMIEVVGPSLDLAHSLDAELYDIFSDATWTATLTNTSDAEVIYDVIFRYGTESISQTLTLAPNTPISVPWTFDVGPMSDRASILVTNHPQSAEQTRFSVLIDSQWIPVREDPRVSLRTDADRYQAGDVVNITLDIAQPIFSAMVFPPKDMPLTVPVIWSSTSLSLTEAITGSYTMAFTLPQRLRTGRYFIRYLFEGEDRTHPIDVFGTDVTARDLQVLDMTPGTSLLPNSAFTATAFIDTPAPVENVLVRVRALTPAGTSVDLGPGSSFTTNLVSGTTELTFTGVLSTVLRGPTQLVLNVLDPVTLAQLGGESTFIDIGNARLIGITTSQGIYAPGTPGTATVTAYGHGSVDLAVVSVDSTTLFSETVVLSGYQEVSFPIPTDSARDDVLVATLTTTDGATMQRMAAYRVFEEYDMLAPEVVTLDPIDGTAVTMQTTPTTITVSGLVTDTSTIRMVLINGLPATVTGNTWTVDIPIELGINLINVVAVDLYGNRGFAAPFYVVGIPQQAISYTLAPLNLALGEQTFAQSVVSSTIATTMTVSFPFTDTAMLPFDGSASSGSLSLEGGFVEWTGEVGPTNPVTITWQGTAILPGQYQSFALVRSEDMVPFTKSQTYTLQIYAGDRRIYLPLVAKP